MCAPLWGRGTVRNVCLFVVFAVLLYISRHDTHFCFAGMALVLPTTRAKDSAIVWMWLVVAAAAATLAEAAAVLEELHCGGPVRALAAPTGVRVAPVLWPTKGASTVADLHAVATYLSFAWSVVRVESTASDGGAPHECLGPDTRPAAVFGFLHPDAAEWLVGQFQPHIDPWGQPFHMPIDGVRSSERAPVSCSGSPYQPLAMPASGTAWCTVRTDWRRPVLTAAGLCLLFGGHFIGRCVVLHYMVAIAVAAIVCMRTVARARFPRAGLLGVGAAFWAGALGPSSGSDAALWRGLMYVGVGVLAGLAAVAVGVTSQLRAHASFRACMCGGLTGLLYLCGLGCLFFSTSDWMLLRANVAVCGVASVGCALWRWHLWRHEK